MRARNGISIIGGIEHVDSAGARRTTVECCALVHRER
jgi:hypothetical protein